MLNKIEIRPAGEGDFPAIVELINTLYGTTYTVEETKRSDQAAARLGLVVGRVGAWKEDRLIGMARYGHKEIASYPDKYEFFVLVRPEHRRQGIGSRIAQTVFQAIRERGGLAAYHSVDEGQTGAMAFLEKLGLKEFSRMILQRLDLRYWDYTDHAQVVEEVREAGVEITSLAQLGLSDKAIQEVYKVHMAVSADQPGDFVFVTEEQFRERELILPDGYILAWKNGRIVGESFMAPYEGDPGALQHRVTGVLREFRGQHIATALKVATVAWAHGHGYHKIDTWIRIENGAMLHINEGVGFRRGLLKITFEKRL